MTPLSITISMSTSFQWRKASVFPLKVILWMNCKTTQENSLAIMQLMRNGSIDGCHICSKVTQQRLESHQVPLTTVVLRNNSLNSRRLLTILMKSLPTSTWASTSGYSSKACMVAVLPSLRTQSLKTSNSAKIQDKGDRLNKNNTTNHQQYKENTSRCQHMKMESSDCTTTPTIATWMHACSA